MHRRSFLPALAALCAALLLAACGSAPKQAAERQHSERGREVVMFAMSLLDTGYRFGGKNPEAGLDCSGMVAYIYERAAGLRVSGSAADIARLGRPVEKTALIPGDLVFFDTSSGLSKILGASSISHVGIYIGDGRFIHAPSAASGRVRIDKLASSYFAPRFTTGRSYFD
jgi:cell wall-associated NlpC family hydrolase